MIVVVATKLNTFTHNFLDAQVFFVFFFERRSDGEYCYFSKINPHTVERKKRYKLVSINNEDESFR